MAKTRDFAKILHRELAEDQELAEAVELEAISADIATKLYDLRTEHGLTQAELAKIAGMHQSVIARLEDADYGRYSVRTLTRIARALGKKVRIEFYACSIPCSAHGTRTWELADLKWPEPRRWHPAIALGIPEPKHTTV